MVTGENKLHTRVGRPRKYPINDLAVGQSIILPWCVDNRGVRTDQKSMHVAIHQEERKFQKKFRTQGSPAGLVVTRIK
jgi:hypothetical protein